jgi:mRNA-degrading endonuclease toxin of MazEF toxin-antitoxin module
MTKSIKITSDDTLKQGHLWVAPIWSYTDKKFVPRPVVIVGNDKANDKIGLIINFITKQGARDEFDVELKHWHSAGLKVKSWVRTSKPLTILKTDLRQDLIMKNGVEQPKGYIGELHEEDLANVLEMCRHIF